VKFVLDERICDGYYYATFFKHYRRLLAHPEVLDNPPEEVIKDQSISLITSSGGLSCTSGSARQSP
jgi:hypothetical protein